jgi:hypothetical protein
MTNQLPNRAMVEYDSEKDQAPPPAFEAVARTVGVPLTALMLTPQGNVIWRKEEAPHAPILPDMPMTIPLPESPIALGHVWTEPYELSVPVPGSGVLPIRTRRRFELKEVKNGVATIAAEYQILSPIRDPAIEAQLVERLTDGTIKFDIDAGRILAQQLDVDKTVLGFSGPASSIHHVMRRTERLIGPHDEVARTPDAQ